MNNLPLPRDKSLKNYATALRSSATKEENHLWYDYLRTYPIRFNRQRIIGRYIVDFYCLKAGIVIELDGGQHYDGGVMMYDAERTSFLERLNLVVLRFTNLEIKQNFEGICMEIDKAVKERLRE